MSAPWLDQTCGPYDLKRNDDIGIIKMTKFIVDLDVRYTFEVETDSMDQAVLDASKFFETMKRSWGEGQNVIWMDTEIVKERVSTINLS